MIFSYTSNLSKFTKLPYTHWSYLIYNDILDLQKDTFDPEVIFAEIYQKLLSTPDIPANFFRTKYNQFIYETMLDVYHYAHLASNPPNTEKITLSTCTRNYLENTLLETQEETFLGDIYKKKKSILEFIDKLKIPPYKIEYCSKALNYYQAMELYIPKTRQQFTPLLDSRDLIFNIRHFPHFIYNPTHCKKGIQYYTFRKYVNEFIEVHPQPYSIVDFNNEYSTYVFEQLHHPIQFQKCMNSFCHHQHDSIQIEQDYFTLWIYTKMYDTKYISLTNYLEETYANIFPFFYNQESNWKDYILRIFTEIQTYNTYILPLLNLTIQNIFFTLCDGDFKKIATISQDYIKEYLKKDTNNRSYFKQLEYAYQESKHYSYPFGRIINLSDMLSDKDSIESIFNSIFSVSFYENDFVNHLNIAINKPENISLSNCHQCIVDHFLLCEKNSLLSIKDIKKFNEFNTKKMLIL